MKRRLLPLLALIPLTTGCSIRSLVNQLEKESDKTADLVCDCFEGDLKTQCLDSASFEFDKDCAVDAYKEDADASRESLNCALDAAKEVRKCIEDKLDCDDPTSTQECYEIYEETDCPELPDKVNDALAECYDDE